MPARVLVIEDNRPNRELMVYLLRAFGHEPSEARDGLEGLSAMRRDRPDLVLCDLDMPRLDGLGLASRAKADPELKDIPLIAVTALALVGDRDLALRAGFDAYITKPIDPETLVAEVLAFLPASGGTNRRE